MKKYAFRRLLQLIPILFAITFLSYGMMRIAGSDVVTQKMWKYRTDCIRRYVKCSQRTAGAGQTISDPVFCVAWETASWRYGKQLCIQSSGFWYVHIEASGNVASYSDIYFADHHYINPSGDSVSSETEYDYGLSDPLMQLYRKHVFLIFLYHCCWCIFLRSGWGFFRL